MFSIWLALAPCWIRSGEWRLQCASCGTGFRYSTIHSIDAWRLCSASAGRWFEHRTRWFGLQVFIKSPRCIASDWISSFVFRFNRLLLASSHLEETYHEPHHGVIGTNECAHNTYTAPSTKKLLPKGKRIDYILYRSGANTEAKVMDYALPLPEFIPNHKVSYSDHEGVYSKLLVTDRIKTNVTDGTCSKPKKHDIDYEATLREGINACEDILKRLRSDKRVYFIMAFTAFIVLLYTIDISPSYGWRMLYLIVKVVFCGFALFFVFMATMWNSIERNGILSSKLAMEIALEMSNVERHNHRQPCF